VTAGITGATRVYLHLAHPSAHARTPQVMNAEFARRGVDAVAVSADVAPGDLGEFACPPGDRDPPASIWMYQGGFHPLYPVSGGRAPEAAGRRGGGST
jgi:hypothetical protein